MFTSTRAVLRAGVSGRDRPLVLAVTDLHDAGDELLDFVEDLAHDDGRVPLLVVGVARPELLDRRPAWGSGKHGVTTMSLAD